MARTMRDVGNERKQLEPALRKEIGHLQKIEKESFAARGRFRERAYLQAVYKVYRCWPVAERKARAEQMARIADVLWRQSTHPIRIIIDCSSPSTDEKTKSRWTQALRCASRQDVKFVRLNDYLMEEGKGGIAGRAREFAAR